MITEGRGVIVIREVLTKEEVRERFERDFAADLEDEIRNQAQECRESKKLEKTRKKHSSLGQQNADTLI